VPVCENCRTARNHRLGNVRIRERAGALQPSPSGFHRLQSRLIEVHVALEDPRDRRLREIIRSGAEATGRDDGASAVERSLYRVRDVRCIVADRRPMRDLDAERRKLAREVGRVGVDREAEKQLIADRDDLYFQSYAVSTRRYVFRYSMSE
jgi:hypothetical protein